MNLELNEVGMTFLVGAFVVLGVEAVIYCLFDRHITYFFEGQWGIARVGETSAALTTGVFVGLSFALGLLVEDACYKFRDPFLLWPFTTTYKLLHANVHADLSDDLKTQIERSLLFKELREKNPRLTSLGEDICRGKLFQHVVRTHGHAVHAWACDGGELPVDSTRGERYAVANSAIRTAFYFSKNRVYTVKNYFDELRRIQAGLNFRVPWRRSVSSVLVFVFLCG